LLRIKFLEVLEVTHTKEKEQKLHVEVRDIRKNEKSENVQKEGVQWGNKLVINNIIFYHTEYIWYLTTQFI
jgi:hypothetical protein